MRGRVLEARSALILLHGKSAEDADVELQIMQSSIALQVG